VNGEYYHVFNRGVDRRSLFESDIDRANFYRRLLKGVPGKRQGLVDLVSYCLMDNHYHLLLRQREDGGVSKFMHALGMGYSHYFNKTHGRVGKLFESTFRAVHIKSEAHYMHITRYIHLNTLDKYLPGWRVAGVKDVDVAMGYIEKYRWSDFGNKRWPKDFILSLFLSMQEYRRFMVEWMERPGLPLSA